MVNNNVPQAKFNVKLAILPKNYKNYTRSRDFALNDSSPTTHFSGIFPRPKLGEMEVYIPLDLWNWTYDITVGSLLELLENIFS